MKYNIINILQKRIKSIKILNYILFLWIIYFSIFVYFFSDMEKNKLAFLFMNTIFLASFFLLNLLYNKELSKRISFMDDLFSNKININEDSTKKEFQKDINFLETSQIYSFFKKIYIKKKISEKDYNELKNIFLKFVPKDFLDEIWIYWNDRISLWDSTKKDLNIMFLDIVGFTSISEKMTPERTLLLLNIYFDWIVDIIKSNWWYVDKFLWDGMMVIFDQPDSDNIIKSAIEIQEFIKKMNFSNASKQIKIWIWINSGEIIMWTIWSKSRMEITVIWDVVNIASRLEKLSRFYNRNIIIWESTFKKIKNINNFRIEYLWKKEIRWKESYMDLYWI